MFAVEVRYEVPRYPGQRGLARCDPGKRGLVGRREVSRRGRKWAAAAAAHQPDGEGGTQTGRVYDAAARERAG